MDSPVTTCVGVMLICLVASAASAQAQQSPNAFVDVRHGYAVTPSEDWEPGDPSAYSVPGELRRAWKVDDVASVTVFVQESEHTLSAQQLLEANVMRVKQRDVDIQVQEVVRIGGLEAMSIVFTGMGTGGALSGGEHGTVKTTQHWAAIPRGKEVIVFLLTTPEADFKTHEKAFAAMLKTVEVEGDWVVSEDAGNLDFELGEGIGGLPKLWGRCGQTESPYRVLLDTKRPHKGKASCRVTFTGKGQAKEREFAGCIQGMSAKPWLGKRVRYSGFLKTKNVDGWASLWMRVDGQKQGQMLAFDNMEARPVTGTTKWTRFEIVLDISPKADSIVFGAQLGGGKGSLWVDDLKFEEVGRDTPLTDISDADNDWNARKSPINLDFELGEGVRKLPKNWGRFGEPLRLYQVALTQKQPHTGKECCEIRFNEALPVEERAFGSCIQSVDAKAWAGKRVRYSGCLRTEAVEEFAGLWMRVDGEAGEPTLAFDNMSSRPVTGTTDWKRYEIVLDVPERAKLVAYGAVLGGKGHVWVDDLTFEEVGLDTAVTDRSKAYRKNTFHERPSNLDFEDGEGDDGDPKGWGRSGEPSHAYKVALDAKHAHAGTACCEIRPSGRGDVREGEFGASFQIVPAKPWLGKRVRYSGYLRTQDVEGNAGLWMRVDGPEPGKSLAFDNMFKRPVKGTTKWKRYEVVLDVPPEATEIYFGALLSGTGRAWVDDLQFEVVGKDTPTTDMYTKKRR